MEKIDFFALAAALKPELDEIRKTLHAHPELGRKEFRTTDFIEQHLQSWGLETYRIADTGVIGILKGTAPDHGQTHHIVGLRSDIDALPITEATGCPFASENPGVMHACGHDVHMTSALGAARILSSHRDLFCGEIRFFFQPDEEGYGGAAEMVQKGVTKDVEAVFGCHVDPNLPVGAIGIRYGKFYASSDMFDITVHGLSSHGAQPEKGHNALAAAADMAVRLTAMTDYDPDHRRVVSIGAFHSGSVRNVIADRAEMNGIIRALGKDVREEAADQLQRIVSESAAKYQTTAEVVFRCRFSGITNTDPETAHAEAVVRKYFGEETLHLIDRPLMISEDFGEFANACGGSFYHLGAGCPRPLHSADFIPDERAYLYGAAMHSAVLYEFLQK